ncbi:hypothetical protein HanXRQr2_Chr05g0208531 [Helianthus annuus]|nr:hypothetical protein HanXRQr2_Chr05g0208531 [Helianthus annuus]
MIKAWELLHEWMKFGKVEAALYNVLLSGLAKEPDYKKINLLLKEMKDKRVIRALAFIQGYPLVASGLKVILLKWTGSEFNSVPFLEVKHWFAVVVWMAVSKIAVHGCSSVWPFEMISGKSYMQVTDVNDELRQKTLIVLGDSKEKLNSNRYLFFVHFYRGPMNSKSWNKTVTDSLGLAQFQFSMVQFWFR